MIAVLKKFLFIMILALMGFFCPQILQILHPNTANATEVGDIIINEIMAGKGGVADWEFIELYNPTSNDVNLNDWAVKKKSSTGSEEPLVTASRLQGKIIVAGGYFLLANQGGYGGDAIVDVSWPKSYTLAYKSNAIVLYNNTGVIINEVSWVEIIEGYSWERKSDNSWQNSASAGGTPKAVNSGQVITSPPATENPPSENPVTSTPSTDVFVSSPSTPSTSATSTGQTNLSYNFGDVVINEFVPDPADEETEFVEIFNKRNESIDLDGWFLYDGSGAKTVLSGSLEKYFIIEKPAGNLNNAGDLITLKWGDVIIDQATYGNWKDGQIDDNAPTASDPKSVARKGDGFNTFNNKNDFAVTATITKGGANVIADVDVSSTETQNIIFPQNYSSDIIINEILPHPLGDEDNGEFIELFNKGDKEVNLENWILSDSSARKYAIKKINTTDSGIASSAQTPSRNDSVIKPQGYFVVYRKDTRIALNNSGDEVKLYQPNAITPAQIVKYEKTIEGQSYNIRNATSSPLVWEWSEITTPGAQNNIKISHEPIVNFDWSGEEIVGQIISFDSSDTEDADGDDLKYLWDFGTNATSTMANPIYIYLTPGNFQISLSVSDNEHTVKEEKVIKIKEAPEISKTATSASKTKTTKSAKTATATSTAKSVSSISKKNSVAANAAIIKTTLENIRELTVGSFVKVEGTVAVLPGIFSSQYFYIIGSPPSTSNEVSGQAGVQVYSNKKLFPSLKIGDKVSVAGQLSESYGELRLKTKAAADIKRIATSTPLTPLAISADEIGEETEAQLVRVSGTVVDKQGSSIYLDDGNSEAEIYCKQGAKINKENINEGDKISVTGIVSQNNEKYRILPRSSADFFKENNLAEEGQVLGEISASDSWQLAQNNKKMKLIEYLLILSGGLIVVLIGVLWKNKK
jgi:DNA/RNA endonuclease YhcR with UshA esterase domain